MSTAGKAGPEQLPDGRGIAVLVIPMPGGVRPPTDDTAAMIAWLFRHGAPRTGEVLTRLQRPSWTIELARCRRNTERAVGQRPLCRCRAGARRSSALSRDASLA